MNGFLYDIFLRNTCYDCPYAKIPGKWYYIRGFLGIGIYEPFNHSTKQGISLVLINSKKDRLYLIIVWVKCILKNVVFKKLKNEM